MVRVQTFSSATLRTMRIRLSSLRVLFRSVKRDSKKSRSTRNFYFLPRCVVSIFKEGVIYDSGTTEMMHRRARKKFEQKRKRRNHLKSEIPRAVLNIAAILYTASLSRFS